MDNQCRLTLDGRRCQRPAFRDGDLCFWHSVWHRTQRQYGRGPRRRRLLPLLPAAGFIFVTGYGLWKFSAAREFVWLLVAAYAGAAALRSLADSFMRAERPLPGSVRWPRLLAYGLALELLVGLGALVAAAAAPQVAGPLNDLLGDRAGPAAGRNLLLTASAVSAMLALNAFMRRVQGQAVARVGGMTWLVGCVGVLNLLDPELIKNPFQSRFFRGEFWEVVTGRPAWFTLLLTYLTSLSIVVKNCGRVLRPRMLLHDSRLMGEVAAQSYLAYFTVPLLAMTAVRYAMAWAGLGGFFWFMPLSVVLAFAACLTLVLRLHRQALLREAMAEGEEAPVAVNARYEFTQEWSQVLVDFGRASRRLRAATYELIRRADPDPGLDRLAPLERTGLMSEEVILALKTERHSGASLSPPVKTGMRQLLRRLEAELGATEEEVSKWRQEVRALEGDGADRLPRGVSDLLPVPLTVQEKMLIKKARIMQIKDVLGL